MPTLSDYESEDDIIAEYEKLDSNIEQNEGSGNEENQEENTPRRVDPTTSSKYTVRNPLPKLNTERLKGPKGIQTIEKYFEGFKFHGKGHEKLDLDRIMKRMEHWAHRLFPKMEFDGFLDRLEKLGTKKDLQVFIKKYRQDMINPDDDVINQDIIDEENEKEQDEPTDEFDILIAEQIEKQKQVVNNQSTSDTLTADALFDKLMSETKSKASQSIKENIGPSQLSDEVKERIERNRQQAIQRRTARLHAIQEEAKKKKLGENIDTQPENNFNSMQVSNETPSLENKDLQEAHKNEKGD
ncbi:PREDICTED: protein TIPIN homolog [Dufourea novaeangliae]|uniref:TIMELESS-interacting protein n=1 Tax=Dufourea novaeangliae TaxID=178035 RepID=A0A154NX78_DUFNO|nr:PREDICTED: protein TIPIN homolog [Dufourea novaeangliae]KZC04181.1 Protein TIPIN like protein [Dufourea novaeangliae]